MHLSRKFLFAAFAIFASLYIFNSTHHVSSSQAGSFASNPHYAEMMRCYSQHLPEPEMMAQKASQNDYSFLNPPKECRNEIKNYMRHCGKNSATPKECSVGYAASWVVANQRKEKAFEEIAASTNDNDYAARNNPYERSMLTCFSERIFFGCGYYWTSDDNHKSAKLLANTDHCRDVAKAYTYWCRNNGGETKFCESMVIEGAKLIIQNAPENIKRRLCPEQEKQQDASLANPACMQAFDYDPARYEKPSRHSLDWCLVNMIRGGTPWSNMDACSLPLGHWCQDMGWGAANSQKCMAAKKAEYEELRTVCGDAAN